jgi:hypothetical protein
MDRIQGVLLGSASTDLGKIVNGVKPDSRGVKVFPPGADLEPSLRLPNGTYLTKPKGFLSFPVLDQPHGPDITLSNIYRTASEVEAEHVTKLLERTRGEATIALASVPPEQLGRGGKILKSMVRLIP